MHLVPARCIAGQVRHMSALAVCAWLSLVHLPVAISWSCSLSMTGSLDQPENLSLARTSLRCLLNAGDLGTALPEGVSDSLLTRDFQGCIRSPCLTFQNSYLQAEIALSCSSISMCSQSG